jgi:RES domain-containing protein
MSEIAFKRCRGVAYRATTYDTPLWVSKNSRPGRWSDPKDETIAQYFALDVASALAEMIRHEDLRSAQAAREMRVSIWELQIDADAIADYSTPERAADKGFEWESLVDDSWDACQEEGRRISRAGGRGVLSPSAALSQGVTLTLFGPRTEIAWGAERSVSAQIPARKILHGAPGENLVEDTRFFGEPYPGVEPTPADQLVLLD